jgi:HPr kinase/phosphorylase
MIAKIRTYKDHNGAYMWQPSLIAGEPDKLLGYPVYTSQYAPEDSIAFGDFSYYNIGDRGARSFKQLTELFAGNGIIGYVAKERVEAIFKLKPAVFLFSRNVIIPQYFIDFGNQYDVPILRSDLRTATLYSKVYGYLRDQLAPRQSVHGVLMDINGMGTLIIGKSAIGKSETALELVKRGHQLVADDRVEIYEKEVGVLIGSAPATIAQYIEVRGVGIVNVIHMFGAGAYRETKKIRLVIELEAWDHNKIYDRLGNSELTETYFHTSLPKIVIPILPGRNNAVLVEAAAMNSKLKYLGLDGSKELIEKIGRITRGEQL